MSTLVLIHIAAGLLGITSGMFVVAGIWLGRRSIFWNLAFFSTSELACATGFAFLPSLGLTSAQLVGLFLTLLLALAAYSLYVQHLEEPWNRIYALAVVGSLFLNVLVTLAQSFIHIHTLREWAPTQRSPLYVGVKDALLVLFIAGALLTARRAGLRQAPAPRTNLSD